MKFLVDECVDAAVIAWLRSQGHDVTAIIETSASISDDQVLKKALLENRVLVTMDKDFGDLVFRGAQAHCGVILLRILSWQPEHIVSLLHDVLVKHGHELDNSFIVATMQSIRIVRTDILQH